MFNYAKPADMMGEIDQQTHAILVRRHKRVNTAIAALVQRNKFRT